MDRTYIDDLYSLWDNQARQLGLEKAKLLDQGLFVQAGTPDALAADEEVRRIYLGTDFRLD